MRAGAHAPATVVSLVLAAACGGGSGPVPPLEGVAGSGEGPVSLLPAGVEAPESVTVSCDTGSVELSSPTVRVSRDGIPLTATNSTEAPILLRVAHESHERLRGTETLPPRRHDQVFFYCPPGPLRLQCKDNQGEPLGRPAILDAVDPDGLWVSDLCNTIGGQAQTPSEQSLTDAEPIVLAVALLRQLGAFDEADTVEPAGYPDHPTGGRSALTGTGRSSPASPSLSASRRRMIRLALRRSTSPTSTGSATDPTPPRRVERIG